MIQEKKRTPVEEAVVEGLADWVDASWATTVVWDLTAPSNRRTLALGLVSELIVQDLMRPGDVDDQGFHRPWSLSAGESLNRIASEWLSDWPNQVPTPGALFWLANTTAGNDLAQRVLAREGGLGQSR